jgi:S-adenosylmethionine/arginine decarboxylase-like enzyme
MKTPPKTEKVLNIWFTQLVNNVGMKVVAGPTSVYVNEPGNEGITGTVTLATSHASIHVWDAQKPAMFQFDLYSCSNYTPHQVLEHIDEWFGLESATWQFIDRNTDEFIVIDSGKYKKRGWGKIRRFVGKILDSSFKSKEEGE